MRKDTIELALAGALLAGAVWGCGGGGKQTGPRISGAAVGTTVVAGSLVEARHGHTATALADGQRVLVAGGETPLSAATRGAELWEAGQSRPLPGLLSEGRAGHVAVLLPDGRVWILGGHDATGRPLASTELFDPQDERFTPGPDLLRARDEAAAAVVQGVLYLACGAGEDSLEAWGLDLSPRGSLVSGLPGGARAGADLVAAPQDGLLYLQGGRADDGSAPPPVWIDLAASRADLALAGQEFLADGRAVLASLDGEPPEVYVLGGTLEERPSRHLQRVRPSDTERVEVGARPLVARQRAAVLGYRSGILLAGGEAQGWAVESVEVIGSTASALAPALAVARVEPVATALAGGAVLFSGGLADDGRPVALTELLIPPGATGPLADVLYARAAADRATRDQLSADVQRLSAELQRALADLATQTAERVRVEGERDAALARVKQLEADLAQAQAQLAALQQQLAQAQANAASSAAQLQQLQQQLSSAQAAANARQQELGQAQAELANLRARIGQLEAEVNALKSERDRLQAELTAARATPRPRQVDRPSTGGG